MKMREGRQDVGCMRCCGADWTEVTSFVIISFLIKTFWFQWKKIYGAAAVAKFILHWITDFKVRGLNLAAFLAMGCNVLDVITLLSEDEGG